MCLHVTLNTRIALSFQQRQCCVDDNNRKTIIVGTAEKEPSRNTPNRTLIASNKTAQRNDKRQKFQRHHTEKKQHTHILVRFDAPSNFTYSIFASSRMGWAGMVGLCRFSPSVIYCAVLFSCCFLSPEWQLWLYAIIPVVFYFAFLRLSFAGIRVCFVPCLFCISNYFVWLSPCVARFGHTRLPVNIQTFCTSSNSLNFAQLSDDCSFSIHFHFRHANSSYTKRIFIT